MNICDKCPIAIRIWASQRLSDITSSFVFLGYTTEAGARSGSKSEEKVCGDMGYMVALKRGGF